MSLSSESANKPISVFDLNISTKLKNALSIYGIKYLHELNNIDLYKFRSIKNIGQKTINELNEFIKLNNIQAKEDIIPQNLLTGKISSTSKIDLRFKDCSLENFTFSDRIMNLFKENNIATVGQWLNEYNKFPYNTINIVFQVLEQVGITKTKNYEYIEIGTPENYLKRIPDVFNDAWIISNCEKLNIKNIGQLAEKFPDIFLQNEKLISEQCFFEKHLLMENTLKNLGITDFPIELNYFQKNDINKKIIDEIVNIPITENLRILINFARMTINPREDDVISLRYGINKITNQQNDYNSSSKEKTLEEIGEMYGITRERVRQIEANAFKKIIKYINNHGKELLNEINTFFGNCGDVITTINYIKEYENEYNLINDIFKKANIPVAINTKLGILIKNNFSLDNLFKKIETAYKKQTDDMFSEDEIRIFFNNKLSQYLKNTTIIQQKIFNKTSNILFEEFKKEYLFCMQENIYKLKQTNNKKRKYNRDEKAIFYIKKLYPNGVHMPIDKDELLKENLSDFIKECPDIVADFKNLRSLTDHIIKENPNIVQCDTGTYIHVDNLEIDWNLVDFAINEIYKNFDNGIYQLKVDKIFDENKEKFLAGNIRNEDLLIGLIRYKNNPDFDIKKREIKKAGMFDRGVQLLNQLEDYIYSFGKNGVKKEELYRYWCTERGWKPLHISFLYDRSNVLYKNNGIFIHKSFLNR
ncbi:hypothetical protein IJ182_05500 [bacterium]|nr:hypothetical protein [bacterium]